MNLPNGERWQVLRGDCLEVMPTLPAASVDLILTDLPYGTTACAWDSVIPFDALWNCYRHLLKPGGAVVLTAAQPFTSALILSNPSLFRYELIWDKVNLFTNHLNADRMPMRQHENILVFGGVGSTYNAQMRPGKPYGGRGTGKVEVYSVEPLDTGNKSGMAQPGSVIQIRGMSSEPRGFHPTQKPVALMAYLIRTYTNPGAVVLDSCMGSGTTGVAALQEDRRFIGIEKDSDYFCVASERISQAAATPNLFADIAVASNLKPITNQEAMAL